MIALYLSKLMYIIERKTIHVIGIISSNHYSYAVEMLTLCLDHLIMCVVCSRYIVLLRGEIKGSIK